MSERERGRESARERERERGLEEGEVIYECVVGLHSLPCPLMQWVVGPERERGRERERERERTGGG